MRCESGWNHSQLNECRAKRVIRVVYSGDFSSMYLVRPHYVSAASRSVTDTLRRFSMNQIDLPPRVMPWEITQR